MRRMRIGVLGVVGSVFFTVINLLAEGNMTTTKGELKKGDTVHIVGDMPETVIAGEAIAIKLILKNDSNEDVLCAYGSPYGDFSITIKDSSGSVVPMTRFGRQVMQGNSGESYKHNVKPLSAGKNAQVCLNITRLFDLTIADKYIVAVARTIDEGLPGKERQVSMETALVVQEPK